MTGSFVLRIEDTDKARNSQEATEAILNAFEWLGLEADGEITYQSKRDDIYAKYIKQLSLMRAKHTNAICQEKSSMHFL